MLHPRGGVKEQAPVQVDREWLVSGNVSPEKFAGYLLTAACWVRRRTVTWPSMQVVADRGGRPARVGAGWVPARRHGPEGTSPRSSPPPSQTPLCYQDPGPPLNFLDGPLIVPTCLRRLPHPRRATHGLVGTITRSEQSAFSAGCVLTETFKAQLHNVPRREHWMRNRKSRARDAVAGPRYRSSSSWARLTSCLAHLTARLALVGVTRAAP